MPGATVVSSGPRRCLCVRQSEHARKRSTSSSATQSRRRAPRRNADARVGATWRGIGRIRRVASWAAHGRAAGDLRNSHGHLLVQATPGAGALCLRYQTLSHLTSPVQGNFSSRVNAGAWRLIPRRATAAGSARARAATAGQQLVQVTPAERHGGCSMDPLYSSAREWCACGVNKCKARVMQAIRSPEAFFPRGQFHRSVQTTALSPPQA